MVEMFNGFVKIFRYVPKQNLPLKIKPLITSPGLPYCSQMKCHETSENDPLQAAFFNPNSP